MINSLSKIVFVVGVIALLPVDAVNAQLQMTKMPTRLEDALLNPNLGLILSTPNQIETSPTLVTRPIVTAPATPRVTSLPASPIYSNEPTRFSTVQPKVDSVTSKLPSIEETETPPRIARRPADLSFSDEVSDAPPAIRSQPRRQAVANNRVEPDVGGNTDLLKPLAPIKGQLQFRVTGVSAMVEGQAADVLVEVYNPTGHAIGPVEVNVQVPDELTITRFDRDAWLDAERRIIAFQLDRIEPETIEKIGMKGISHTPGKTSLNVALISGKTMVAQRSVNTQVFPQQVARKQTFGDDEPAETIRK